MTDIRGAYGVERVLRRADVLQATHLRALHMGMDAPFKLRQIDHIVLRVRDLRAALRFYQDALGCSLDNVQETVGLWQLRAGTSLIDIIPLHGVLGKIGGAGPGPQGHNVDHFALQVTPWDEDAIREHLRRNAVSVVDAGQRYGAEGIGPSIYILDPDGNTVELKGPALEP